mgnify:CR=1 FL=1
MGHGVERRKETCEHDESRLHTEVLRPRKDGRSLFFIILSVCERRIDETNTVTQE